jgi:hypothetical protein
MSILAAASHATHSHPSTGLGSEIIYLAAIAALVLWVILYLIYRVVMTGRKDFGMPVRRRLFALHLRVDRDQSADVPFWWTDLQIQRAVRAHWRQTLRAPFASGSEANPAS